LNYDEPFRLVLLAGVAITGVDLFSLLFTTATMPRLISAAVNLEKSNDKLLPNRLLEMPVMNTWGRLWMPSANWRLPSN